MKGSPDRASWLRHVPHVPWEVGLGLLAAAGAGLAYLAARHALEVVIALVAFGLLVVLQRTVADWLRDHLGAATVNVLLVALVAAGTWHFLASDDGRRQVKQVLAGAERRGFQTLWIDTLGVEVPPPAPAVAPSSGGGTAQSSSGASRSPEASSQTPRQQRVAGERTLPPGRMPGGAAGAPTKGPASSGTTEASSTPRGAAMSTGSTSDGTSTDAGELSTRVPKSGGDVTGRVAPGQRQRVTLHISVDPARAVAGDSVTVIVEALVPSDGVPGGEVEISVNGLPVAKRQLDWRGRAEFTLKGLKAGAYALRANLDSDSWMASPVAIRFRVEQS